MSAVAGRLVERDRELERITLLLDRAGAAEGGAVVVRGPPGVGKTRLLGAGADIARGRGWRVLAARAAKLERAYAFGIVRQLFEETARTAAPASLSGAAALAAPALLPELGAASGGTDRDFGTLHGLYWLTSNLADEAPLLLTIDDCQWSDDASLRFLRFLAPRLDGIRVALLMTMHGDTPSIGADAFELEALSVAGAAALLSDYAPADVALPFATACHAATGGNPFLLVELARTLEEHGVDFASPDTAAIATTAPRGVAAAVRSRLARLDAAESDLVATLAVLGDGTPLELCARVTGVPPDAATAAAAALVEAHVLADELPLRFVHGIVRDAIAVRIGSARKASLHLRAAEVLRDRGAPAEEVAMHLSTTEPAGLHWVVDALVRGARSAAARGAPNVAAALLERALLEPPDADSRAGILLELGQLETALGAATAVDHLAEAYETALDPLLRARCARDLGAAQVTQPRERRDIGLVDRAREEIETIDRELAFELAGVGANLRAMSRNDIGSMNELLERYADLEGRTPAECALLAALAHARMDRGAPAALACDAAERAVAYEESIGREGLATRSLISCMLVLVNADRLDLAGRIVGLAIDGARRRGAVATFATAMALKSSVAFARGDVAEAEADARESLEVAPERNWIRMPACGRLVETLIERGSVDDAEKLLVEHDLLGEMPDIRPAAVLLHGRGALRLARGATREGLDDLRAGSERIARFTGAGIVGVDTLLLVALAYHRLEARDEARRSARDALERAEAWGVPSWVGRARRVCGLVSERGDAIDQLRAAVRELEASPRRLEHARALLDLGAALRRAGERAASREPLREALALAEACGGRAVWRSAREELDASGVRVPRETRTGIASLTPSERRIAERAAAGASNREIAQALFVTVKTVEMHLGHVYSKLGIASRRDLPRTLVVEV